MHHDCVVETDDPCDDCSHWAGNLGVTRDGP